MPSYFVARLLEDEVVREHKNLYGKGITPHYNAKKDVVQISFENHTLGDAQLWLKEHEFPDVEIIDDAPVETHSRNFGYPFTDIGGKFEKTPEGGLRVRGVKLLAAGTWTDSAQKTPCEYSPDVLRKFAANWSDNAIWARHFGGVPRSITDKVGIVENPRYDSDAVVGDLHYHGLTQQSRDTISMIENGLANYVSVETVSKDKWNVGKKAYTADEIGFTGLATVNQGACRVCKIRESEESAPMIQEDEEVGKTIKENETVSTDESLENIRQIIRVGLEKKLNIDETTIGKFLSVIATLPDTVVYTVYGGGTTEKTYRIPFTFENNTPTFGEPSEVVVAYKDINEDEEPPKMGAFEETMETKELEDLVSKQAEVIKELAAKIEAIEKTPAPETLAESATVKEYEYAPYQVEFKNNIIKRRQ